MDESGPDGQLGVVGVLLPVAVALIFRVSLVVLRVGGGLPAVAVQALETSRLFLGCAEPWHLLSPTVTPPDPRLRTRWPQSTCWWRSAGALG